jgi:hypothetical protein
MKNFLDDLMVVLGDSNTAGTLYVSVTGLLEFTKTFLAPLPHTQPDKHLKFYCKNNY